MIIWGYEYMGVRGQGVVVRPPMTAEEDSKAYQVSLTKQHQKHTRLLS